MNRGSEVGRAATTPTCTRFNEAPIHESGKCVGVEVAEEVVVASMRPRFMNRGSLPYDSG